jgi:MOSC domain-containing protein YiiM
MARVVSVNVGMPRPAAWAGIGRTAIDKGPVHGKVPVERLGLAGDQVGDTVHHGGLDQAVYAYAREDLDWWAAELGRPIREGQFGENLTTCGVDLNDAEVGERWEIGSVVLEVAMVRIPCNDFKSWQRRNGYDDRAWVRRFTEHGRPGAYFRVVGDGHLGAGDDIRVVHQPGHGVTVATMFRALTTERALLPQLLAVDGLARRARRTVEEHLARATAP